MFKNYPVSSNQISVLSDKLSKFDYLNSLFKTATIKDDGRDFAILLWQLHKMTNLKSEKCPKSEIECFTTLHFEMLFYLFPFRSEAEDFTP